MSKSKSMTPETARGILYGWKKGTLTAEEKRMALKEDLRILISHWWEEYTNGTQDPNWQDGANLNLTRIHIINTVNGLKDFSEDCSANIPREVPDDLMIPSGKYFKLRYERFRKAGKHMTIASAQETLF